MNSHFLERVTEALAAERLDAYRQDGAEPAIALARYLWNMALSEALYSPLQFAEVALRNTLHRSLKTRYASDAWYESPAVPLAEWQRQMIAEACAQLRDHGKEVTAGRVVAGLSLGFWTGFLNKRQSRTGLGHYLVKNAFPHAPREERDLSKQDARWAVIRSLRNRVFHHERIVHFADLAGQHRTILDVIAWISPEMHEVALKLDRFPAIRTAGLAPWIGKIGQHWPHQP